MQTGKKRHLIRIEQPVSVKDTSNGSVTVTWQLFKNMWASIETMRSYEKQASQASWPGADVRIGIDYVEGLLPTFRAKKGIVIYSILNIQNVDEMNRDIYLICQSGVKSS